MNDVKGLKLFFLSLLLFEPLTCCQLLMTGKSKMLTTTGKVYVSGTQVQSPAAGSIANRQRPTRRDRFLFLSHSEKRNC